ncbi:hypothetical protein [Diaminobutyricimonas sp. LJ205]|uniref:hypothetical protein n=1 Tax=Diaminobutyricimonas sp. LJ205 TaxID=2683590 RepID=UPI0012F4EA5B|nr:hypothetical protein [Diaminobutyricimonas sp. LJ205]
MSTLNHGRTLVGNKWMLVGGIVYLLEWVAIIGSGLLGVADTHAASGQTDSMVEAYAGRVDVVAWMAGWFAVVLLGRILVFVALRHALVSSGHGHPLLDFAVLAATVSVAMEIAAYAMSTAAATFAENDVTGTLFLDQAGVWLNWMIAGGLGVAILCSSYVMLRSGLFPKALGIIGIVSAVPLIVAQFLIAPAFSEIVNLLTFFVFLFWIWMIWAGVYLWRKTPKRAAVTPLADPEDARVSPQD